MMPHLDPQRASALRKPAVFWSLAAVAVVLRLLCMRWPAHYDQVSWSLVADLVLDGKNVYASTPRYNYGPAWMGILAVLKWIAGDAHFRLAVCLFLSAIDVTTAALLRSRGFALAAVLFLFSPWTIFITGHQHMFDNVAVLLGLVAVFRVEGRQSTRADDGSLSTLPLHGTFIGAALLGCSLVVKHVLWIFSVWMAFRTQNFPRRIIWLTVPVGMFVLSFAPFWSAGREGILTNVLHYAASSNAPLFYLFSPNVVDLLLGYGPHPRLVRLLFGASLILAGVLLRRRSLLEWYLAYLLFVVLLSSAIWNQFLVIPVLFTLLHRNVWGLFYHLLAIPYYVCSYTALDGVLWLPESLQSAGRWLDLYGPHLFVILLLLCYLKAFWKDEMRTAWQRIKGRVVGSICGHE